MPWDSDSLSQQRKLGEDSRVEFKEAGFSASHREAVADELAAFGNTIGGTLIFSVSDVGQVRPMHREQMDALEAFVSEICADSIKPPLPFVTQRLALPDGSFVLVVEVKQSALVHKTPSPFFVRHRDTPLTWSEIGSHQNRCQWVYQRRSPRRQAACPARPGSYIRSSTIATACTFTRRTLPLMKANNNPCISN